MGWRTGVSMEARVAPPGRSGADAGVTPAAGGPFAGLSPPTRRTGCQTLASPLLAGGGTAGRGGCPAAELDAITVPEGAAGVAVVGVSVGASGASGAKR